MNIINIVYYRDGGSVGIQTDRDDVLDISIDRQIHSANQNQIYIGTPNTKIENRLVLHGDAILLETVNAMADYIKDLQWKLRDPINYNQLRNTKYSSRY